MSISSINSGSSSIMSGMKGMQRPDPSKMADQLFSKLDTKGQGYIEKGGLQAALDKVSKTDGSNNASNSTSVDDMFTKMDSDGNGKVTKKEMSATFEKMASQLDGPFPRMRLQEGQSEGQGNMPPPPPPGGGQGTQKVSSTDNSSQGSDPADTNSDGEVSTQEALAYTEKQISSGTDTSSTSSVDTQLMQMRAGWLRRHKMADKVIKALPKINQSQCQKI